MPVLSQSPLITYTANGSVTAFAYPFQILNAADLKVYVDGVLATTGFIISGVGVAAGGNVTFTVAPTAGSAVRLVRTTSITRVTDYIEGGAIPASTLDTDFDRTVMMIQELDALSVKETSSGVIDLTGRKIINIGTPILNGDAANKAYVDATLPAAVAAAAASASASNLSAEAAAASAYDSYLAAISANQSSVDAANSAAAGVAEVQAILATTVKKTSDTGAFKPPVGPSADRPLAPEYGDTRVNSELGIVSATSLL